MHLQIHRVFSRTPCLLTSTRALRQPPTLRLRGPVAVHLREIIPGRAKRHIHTLVSPLHDILLCTWAHTVLIASRSNTPSCCQENKETHTLFILTSNGGGALPTTMAHHAIGQTTRSPWFVCPVCKTGLRFEGNADARVPPIGNPSALFFDERSRAYQSFQMYQLGSRQFSLQCPLCAGRGGRTTLVLEVQIHTYPNA